VRFVAGVDFPVSVQAAWVRQTFSAYFTLNRRLTVRSNLTGSNSTKWLFVRFLNGPPPGLLRSVGQVTQRVERAHRAQRVHRSKAGHARHPVQPGVARVHEVGTDSRRDVDPQSLWQGPQGRRAASLRLLLMVIPAGVPLLPGVSPGVPGGGPVGHVVVDAAHVAAEATQLLQAVHPRVAVSVSCSPQVLSKSHAHARIIRGIVGRSGAGRAPACLEVRAQDGVLWGNVDLSGSAGAEVYGLVAHHVVFGLQAHAVLLVGGDGVGRALRHGCERGDSKVGRNLRVPVARADQTVVAAQSQLFRRRRFSAFGSAPTGTALATGGAVARQRLDVVVTIAAAAGFVHHQRLLVNDQRRVVRVGGLVEDEGWDLGRGEAAYLERGGCAQDLLEVALAHRDGAQVHVFKQQAHVVVRHVLEEDYRVLARSG